jgi:hypothetical protein
MLKTRLQRFMGVLMVALMVSGCALAQYGGGGGTMGGGTAGTGTYTPGSRSYGNGAVIGGAVAGGAGAAALLYYTLHHRRAVVGCVAPDGKSLTTDDGKHAYQLAGMQVTGGNRVSVVGKKGKSDLGADQLEVKTVKKDFGQCQETQAGLVGQH